MTKPNEGVTQGPTTADDTASPSLLTGLAALAALGTLATSIILPSLPAIARTMAVTTSQLGILISAFFLTFGAGQLVVGPLSDRFGRKPFILGGLLVFVVGSLLCALADDLGTLVVGRIIQALGASAAAALSRAIARDRFEGTALGRALAITIIATAAAPGFSPLLGGGLEHVFGWRSAFVLVALLGLLLAGFYALRIGESHAPDRRVETSARDMVADYARLAGDPAFALPALAVALLMGGLFGMFAASPAILMEGLGFSALQLGLFFSATVLVVFAAGMLAPRWAARWGGRAVAGAGLVIAFGGAVSLLGWSAAGYLTLPTYAVSTSLFLFGFGLANPLGTALALSPFGERAGLASALLGFLQMMSAALGTMLATSFAVAPMLALGAVQLLFFATALIIFRFTANAIAPRPART